MASSELLDFTSLLTPITDDQRTGADLREDYSPSSPYQSIKSSRNSARDAERKSIHDPNNSDANTYWRNIVSEAPGIISKKSKDLEVACWLTEALIRRHGAQGLRDGFRLILALVQDFWGDDLYPMPDEDGIETRVAPLSGLNGEGAEGVLIAPIRQIHITEGNSLGPFSLWQYQQALNNDNISDDNLKDKKVAQLGISLEDIEKSVAESSDEFFINLKDDLTQSIDSYKEIGLSLETSCGPENAPSTRTIIEILEECRGAVLHLARNKLPQETPEIPTEDTEDEVLDTENAPSAQPKTLVKAAVMTRESAFKEILQLAEFFRKTEPHSPVSYMLEKAVRWGELPLEGLIRELITDNNSLERFSDLTGVKVEH